MQISASLTVLLLTSLCVATRPLLLPSKTSSPSPHTIQVPGHPWPSAPWIFGVRDPGVTAAFEHYGRQQVCLEGDMECMQRILVGILQIEKTVSEEYERGQGNVQSFTEDGVHFWIKQHEATSLGLIEDLLATLHICENYFGATEVTHAGLLASGILMADFQLMFPGF